MADHHADAPSEAYEALHRIDQSRAAAYAKVASGSWRHDIVSALVVAGMVGAQTLPAPWHILSTAFGGAVLGIMAAGLAERRGVRVTGVTPPRARWVAMGMILAVGAALFASLILGRHVGPSWAPAPLAVLAGLIVLAGARLWLHVYRAQIGKAGAHG